MVLDIMMESTKHSVLNINSHFFYFEFLQHHSSKSLSNVYSAAAAEQKVAVWTKDKTNAKKPLLRVWRR